MAAHYLEGLRGVLKLFNNNTRKEKLDFVLEPLQAMTQLAFLSFCPVGTKLTIHDNLLYIQMPSLSQGLIRYWNEDTKDDLYFLLNVFRRFLIYYDFLKDDFPELYKLLIHYGQKGLDKLIQTYANAEKVSLLHSLKMYKLILKNSEFFESLNNEYYDSASVKSPRKPRVKKSEKKSYVTRNKETAETSSSDHSDSHDSSDNDHDHDSDDNVSVASASSKRSTRRETYESRLFMNWFSQMEDSQEHRVVESQMINFDNVFKQIVEIYNFEYLKLYESTLKTVMLNPTNVENTIKGIEMILKPVNEKIKKWINEHIAL